MSNLKRIGINMISGGAGYILPMAINVLSAPFILNELGEDLYGLQVLANVIIGYLIVADMGLDIPITHKVSEYQARGQHDHQSKFLLATIKIYFIIGICGMGLLLLLTNSLIEWLSIPSEISHTAKIVFYMSALGFLGSIINMWGKAVFNGLQRYDIANGVNICNNLLGVGVGIMLIIEGYGIIGFFSARIGGFLLSGFSYLLFAGKYVKTATLRPFIDKAIWNLLKKQIGYGSSLRISGMIFARMDQTLISAWVGVSAVAVYSFPFLIATTLSGLIASLTHFAFPLVTALTTTRSSDNINSFFFKITKFIVSISTMLFFPFLIYGDKLLAMWINPDVANKGYTVMLFLIVSFYVNSCITIAINAFLMGQGRLKYFTFYAIGRGVALFVSFLILIRYFSMEGAGISYILVLLIDIFFAVFTVKRKLNFDIGYLLSAAYFKPFVLGVFLGICAFLLRNYVNTWAELIFAILLFEGLYILLAFVLGIIDESDKKVIYSIIGKSKPPVL